MALRRPDASPQAYGTAYRKAAEQLLRDLPMIYLWHNKWLWASTIKLSGLSIYPDGLIRPQGLRLQ